MMKDTSLIPDPTLREIIGFGRKCASALQIITAEDNDHLGHAGSRGHKPWN